MGNERRLETTQAERDRWVVVGESGSVIRLPTLLQLCQLTLGAYVCSSLQLLADRLT